MIYKPPKKLKIGYSYDLTVNSIDRYHGLKEIKSVSNITNKKRVDNYETFYKDGNRIDLFDFNNQNNIVKNLTGIYKNNYLYFSNKKIKLYFKKGVKKPDQGKTITIRSGHLSVYKTKIQITLYQEDDIKIIY